MISSMKRLELVNKYLDTFKAQGNLPEQNRMMEDLYLLNKFLEDGNLHKLDTKEKGRPGIR